MNHSPDSERAVSDVLGAVILIGVIATVLALAGVIAFSQPLPQQMPALNARIWNDTSYIYIKHDGGDSLRAAELQLKVDGTVPVFNLTTAPTVPWETLSIGDTLQTPMLSSSQFPSVQIIYTGYGSSAIVLASYGLVGTSVGTITTTTTPTTIPTTPPSAPTFTSLTPNIGPITGGTDLHIYGTGFTGASSVTFDGIAATTFTVTSDMLIIAVTPAHAAGTVNVTITTPGGIATGTGAYTYGSAPAFVSIVPSTGPTIGGTGVTITGTNFIGTTAVTFGGTSATGFSVINSTSITATTPGHAAGLVDVVVTTPNGTATGTGVYTYANTRVQIFYDNFESGFTGWTTVGTVNRGTYTPRNGSYDIRLTAPTSTTNARMTRAISTSGYSSVNVQFAWAAQSLESSENLYAEYSTNSGSSWSTLTTITNTGTPSSLTVYSSALPAADNNASFQLRFRLSARQVSGNNDYGYVDDVKVTGIPI